MRKAITTATHTGRVENYNYGKPYRYAVYLRETKLYWINADTGTKYRKKGGSIPNGNIWSPTTLQLDSVKPIVV